MIKEITGVTLIAIIKISIMSTTDKIKMQINACHKLIKLNQDK